MLYNITLEYKYQRSWFEEASTIFEDKCTLERLPREKYLTMKDVMFLTDASKENVIEYVTQHASIHGFMYRDTLFVHPTKILNIYKCLLQASIDKINPKDRIFFH